MFSLSLGACAHPHQGYVVQHAPRTPSGPPLYIYNPPPTYCYPPRTQTVAPRVCYVQPWSNGFVPTPTASGFVPPDPWAPVSAPRINMPGRRIIIPER